MSKYFKKLMSEGHCVIKNVFNEKYCDLLIDRIEFLANKKRAKNLMWMKVPNLGKKLSEI